MGCSNSRKPPLQTYTVSYCSLFLIDQNKYKINLVAKEEIVKKKERKFFEQIGRKNKEILDFLKNKNFEQNTLFYIYIKKQQQIKNIYQMINLIPNDIKDLDIIFLLSTEYVEYFPNFFIEKKTQNLTDTDFIGTEIDLNDMMENLEYMNNINITEDDVNYEIDYNKREEEDNEELERKDEIIINGIINNDSIDDIKQNFLENEEIIKVFISDIRIEDKESFVELIIFFYNKDIKIFSFHDTNINDTDEIIFYTIVETIEKNYSIRYLDLHNCNLNDNNINDLIRAIGDKRIRYLDLSKNGITAEGASTISKFLFDNKTLQKLNLSNNNSSLFKSEGIEYIANSLIEHPNIKYIDFSGMNITGCGEFISELISQNKNIETLLIKNNALNSNDFRNIFNAVKSNKFLKFIDISYNDMGGNSALEYIRDAIKENESLNKLNIDKININNDNYKIIFEGIENNKNISKYSLSENNINIKIVIDFFMRQLHVKNLKFIKGDKNNNTKLTLDEKKIIDKCKKERPDLNIVIN